jgi:hypothetical protein
MVFEKATVARRMKYHGKVPTEERIGFKDVDLSTVSDARLPPIKVPKKSDADKS